MKHLSEVAGSRTNGVLTRGDLAAWVLFTNPPVIAAHADLQQVAQHQEISFGQTTMLIL
jgi:hypothetical protein